MQRKFIIWGLTILILFISTILIGCARDDANSEKSLFYLPELDVSLEENCDENSLYLLDLIGFAEYSYITLTIYYRDFSVLTPAPVRLEQLVGGMYDYKIVVSLPLLMDHEDLILQLLYTRVRPRETGAAIDARLYYVFADREYGEILSVVAFTRDAGTVLVNGVEVERNNIFFEAVLPFLPEDAAAKIRSIVGI